MKRVINFNPGPAAIPQVVLEQARDEMLDWRGTGMSILEISHRSKEYDAMHTETTVLFREIAGMGPEWKILFCTGGASMQFAMIPMNLLPAGKSADYIVTGNWSKAALKEAKMLGAVNVTTTEENGTYKRIPFQSELKLDPNAAYVHMTSNNTIMGSQWQYWPEVGKVPLVADMSSDIFSRTFPVEKFSLIYSGIQKNLGPSGLTVVAIKEDMLAKCAPELPTMLAYKTYADSNSLYNTPPCFNIYILNLVLQWVKKSGGLPALEKVTEEKAKLLYDVIDSSGGFYSCPVAKDARSRMNVVFRLSTEDLEGKLVKEAKDAGIIGVKGHRSVGGIRFSIYNGCSLPQVRESAAFLKDFLKKNG